MTSRRVSDYLEADGKAASDSVISFEIAVPPDGKSGGKLSNKQHCKMN